MRELRAWLKEGDGDAVLVTVAAVDGSAPRGPGTHMLVDGTGQWGTIGGGHLELHAAEVARAMLAVAVHEGQAPRRLERCPLGPSLGQCCGGVVHLAFELADRAHLALLAAHAATDCWRAVALDGAPDLALFDGRGRPLDGAGLADDTSTSAASTFAASVLAASPSTAGTRVLHAPDERRWLLDLVAAPRNHLMLFGAGHVGAAIVQAMADLPCRIAWVDERADLFPAQVPEAVAVEATDTPEALIDAAPPGTAFLVMTHSHALDQQLLEAILKRPGGEGADWVGLIGSETKRRQFEHRLRARGIDEARLAAMACPIGIPGIEGKEPPVIAVAVAAQLLMLWEARRKKFIFHSGTS